MAYKVKCCETHATTLEKYIIVNALHIGVICNNYKINKVYFLMKNTHLACLKNLQSAGQRWTL